MGQNNSKADSAFLNKIIKTDIDDVNFNSVDQIDKKRYEFIHSLKNRYYSDDNSFINKLNIGYFLMVKYLIRISLVLDYMNGSNKSLFGSSPEYKNLKTFKEDFEYFKKNLDKFLRNTNKEIDEYISRLERNNGGTSVIKNKNLEIKKEIINIVNKNKSIYKTNTKNYINKYSSKINTVENIKKLSPVEMRTLRIPIEMENYV